jgi:hypothetical protein
MNNEQAKNLGLLGMGVGLIGIGAMFLFGQLLGINIIGTLWPFFIIVPGLLFFIGMVALGKSGAPLAIPGSIVTMIGLILLFQNVTGLWATWAYAWALIFPTSVGVGIAIAGLWGDDPRAARAGGTMALVGLIIFLAFAVFFELLLNISGLRTGPIGRVLLPLLLIGAGVVVLLLAFLPRRSHSRGF